MATYPAYGQLRGTQITRLSGIVTDEGGNGSLWVRNTYSTDKYAFTLVHYLTASQLSTLMTFYTTNKLVTWDLVYQDDSATYTGLVFLDAPQREVVKKDYFKVTVRARQQ